MAACVSSGASSGKGEENSEQASLTNLGLHIDPPSVFGDDAMADGQAEPGPSLFALGSKKRLEDLPQQFRGHAAATILKLDGDLLPRVGGLLERPDRQSSLPVARLEGVNGQSQKNLA